MWHMLLKRKEDPRHKYSAIITRNLGILQSIAVKNSAIIVKRRAILLKTIAYDLRINKAKDSTLLPRLI